MKKLIFTAIVFQLLLLFYSCGGVIGNIGKYTFTDISASDLKEALENVYSRYPQLTKTDTTLYGNNDGDTFYYIYKRDSEKLVFKCRVITYPPPYEKEVDLSLITATAWGKVMELAPKMSFFERRKYRILFEKHILAKILDELK